MSRINISLSSQTADLFGDDGKLIKRYPVSTSRYGAGERNGSFCTPRGKHIVRAKIGAGQPQNAVFVERRPTGELYTNELAEEFKDRDWILTRMNVSSVILQD